MSDRTRSVIDYIVACVNDFSDSHRLQPASGIEYLMLHGGIEFLERNYDIEHTYSIEDAVSDMTAVCRKNGGTL